nr:type II toxin-antitoxin system death-on-curing family toxin [Paracraurococcus ruber]
MTPDVVLAIHEEQLAEHGGGEGLRDLGLLESALARPRNLPAHGQPDLPELAAALGFGIARNHPFVDGNKRRAHVAVGTFLVLNGLDLVAGDAECVVVMLDLAAGDLPEEGFAAWLRDDLRRQG